MKSRFLLVIAVLAALSSWSEGRPAIGSASNERVAFDEMGISLLVPADTDLLGPGRKEPVNYTWPWLATKHGKIEVAIASPAIGNTLSEKIAHYLEHVSGKTSITTSEIATRQIGGMEIARAVCAGERNFPIVRYYLLTPDDRLAFFHLHSWDDLDALESVVLSMQKIEQGSAASP